MSLPWASADYLDGDVFRLNIRAQPCTRAQIKLMLDVDSKLSEMADIVAKYSGAR